MTACTRVDVPVDGAPSFHPWTCLDHFSGGFHCSVSLHGIVSCNNSSLGALFHGKEMSSWTQEGSVAPIFDASLDHPPFFLSQKHFECCGRHLSQFAMFISGFINSFLQI